MGIPRRLATVASATLLAATAVAAPAAVADPEKSGNPTHSTALTT